MVGGDHLSREVQDAMCAGFRIEAAHMNIGDKVAVGVRVTGARAVRHVGGKAFRRGQARAFADQQNGDARIQQLADFIQDSDAAVVDHERSADGPVAGPSAGIKQRKKRRDLCGDRRHGQAVADSDLNVPVRSASLFYFDD